jgi:hypothetical protein
VWALAAISFALGDPATGVAIGLAFGIGRAIPVVVLAPLADHRIGIRCTELMAERPALYRRARLGDALALGVAAMVLVTTSGSATAAHIAARPGADPSTAAGELAYQRPDRKGVLVQAGSGTAVKLPGREPVIGGPLLADRAKGGIEVRSRRTRERIASLDVPGVDAMAISKSWLVFVQSKGGHDVLKASHLGADRTPGPAKVIVRLRHPARIGHPSLDGGAVAYGVARPARSRIVVRHLRSGRSSIVLSADRAQLTNPSIRNGKLVFVRAIRERQSPQLDTAPPLDQDLILTDVGGHGMQTLYSLGAHGRLWTTAIAAGKAYVTVLRGHRSQILRVDR